ncbi:hypothetical protein U1Q18_020549 [Sarracenia purpurea var. burkii]
MPRKNTQMLLHLQLGIPITDFGSISPNVLNWRKEAGAVVFYEELLGWFVVVVSVWFVGVGEPVGWRGGVQLVLWCFIVAMSLRSCWDGGVFSCWCWVLFLEKLLWGGVLWGVDAVVECWCNGGVMRYWVVLLLGFNISTPATIEIQNQLASSFRSLGGGGCGDLRNRVCNWLMLDTIGAEFGVGPGAVDETAPKEFLSYCLKITCYLRDVLIHSSFFAGSIGLGLCAGVGWLVGW